ncbi:hypothetical protein RirG_236170 [Rhizophagus irregularis DAOM 197198w]|uniref:Transmembrane protein 188 n=1 Tax=Rhizophagus irregularis (strain DAOM 197198w) TaxID=1432141 RepID=A0A015IAN0_RHIIW|nr:hypothetical protein RirG_236170 [Rhizophagus irregularis DAOM 197198w]
MHTRSRNFAQINPSSSTSFESPVLPTENNPKVPLSPAFNDTTSFSNYSSTTPPNNHQRYKDLLIFEERLKQNLHQLQRRSYKYEAFLGLNCLLLPILIYAVFFYESKNPTFQFFSKLFLFIAVTTLLMFFMKNIYAEKVRVATRYFFYNFFFNFMSFSCNSNLILQKIYKKFTTDLYHNVIAY